MCAVVGREEQRAVDVRQVIGVRVAAPGLMSLTRTVPAAVPSLFHSSVPLVASSSAEKNSVPLTFVRFAGRACAARVDVLDQDGAGGGAVALPRSRPVLAIGREKERAVQVREFMAT